ncbi:MAG: dephospho-CoA kinase [Dysgonamonadaceae bacterium]|jgi:dephospho-CoA kinase|nr:dephospho-CoA kinase [Dysgonamonadaceae bacterium]
MIQIAVTGGIGSGKTVVSEILRLLSIPVYNADAESKRLTDSSPLIRQALTGRFGDDLYPANGPLDKARLASLIFAGKENLQFVNSIIHPVVLQDFIQWTDKLKLPVVAMESAILFESGFDQYVTHTICVSAPLELRITRAMNRDAASREQILRRIAHQLPDKCKCERSNFVIYNDEIQPLIPQVEKIVEQIRA